MEAGRLQQGSNKSTKFECLKSNLSAKAEGEGGNKSVKISLIRAVPAIGRSFTFY